METLSGRLRRLAALGEFREHGRELEEAAREAQLLEAEVRHLRAVLAGDVAPTRTPMNRQRLAGPEDEERRGGVPGLEADD
jgi:hypothetical protein